MSNHPNSTCCTIQIAQQVEFYTQNWKIGFETVKNTST